MGWFSNLMGKKKFNNDIQGYQTYGNDTMRYGRDVTQRAIGSLDELDTSLSETVAKGGLPEDVRKSYRVGQGRITDEGARGNAAFATSLLQRARATGGAITPQAALDAQVEFGANTADAQFNARNALTSEEATASMENTNRLLEAIERIRTTKVGAGLSEQEIGSAAYRNALDITQRRRAATQQAVASWYSTYSSGGKR